MTFIMGRQPLVALVVCLGLGLAPRPGWAQGVDLTSFRQLPILDGGRVKPVDTFCRETVLAVFDEELFEGMDPVETVVSLAFRPERWRDKKLIAISYRPHRKTLGLLPREGVVSYAELMKNKAFLKLVEELEHPGHDGKEDGESRRESGRLYSRVSTIDALFNHKAFRIVPVAGQPDAPWSSPVGAASDPRGKAIGDAWRSAQQAYLAGNSAAWEKAVADLAQQAAGAAPKQYPAAWTLSLETLYNRLRPFRVSACLYAAAFCLLLAPFVGSLLVLFWPVGIALTAVGFAGFTGIGLPVPLLAVLPGWIKLSICPLLFASGLALILARLWAGRPWPTTVATSLLILGWALNAGGLVARVVLSGRGPISNMFESMVYLGWGAVTLALLFGIRFGIAHFGAAAGLVGALMLVTAENSFDPFIAPLVPVLRSYWLWIHVQVIMLGYAGLFLAIVAGHLRLLMSLGDRADRAPLRTVDAVLYRSLQAGTACLGAGIVLGGIWADYSWGRYWGWDPKETWSLITFLYYAAISHGRFGGWLTGSGVATGSVLGIFPLLMTYYGVNFLLVGLHSYAGADQHAGATFIDKLLVVPIWLKLFTLAEIVFLQIADCLVIRAGSIVGTSLAVQVVFFAVVWTKISWWAVALLVAQAILAAVFWTSGRRSEEPRAPDPGPLPDACA
ncbi:MAG: cytochrome c biogenesis protein CcsA [Candidatus Riflebacteria bacterium]|nr:cytochrome c biogenesis protein CcsA [Candidatus Riflebacteria bacterium]